MKELKNMKGITLVSLVITIIVLIILAAVSINLTIGTDGIITRAKEAAENMEIAAVEEQVRLNELYQQLDGSVESGGVSYDKIAQLREQYDNLNTEYTDFKTQIAEAITNKGVETSSTDSVETMVSNITSILGNVGSLKDTINGDYKKGDIFVYEPSNAEKDDLIIVSASIYSWGSSASINTTDVEKIGEITKSNTGTWSTTIITGIYKATSNTPKVNITMNDGSGEVSYFQYNCMLLR